MEVHKGEDEDFLPSFFNWCHAIWNILI